VPELPEVEITARRLDAALRGAEVESALAPGLNALKTFDPPLAALDGRAIAGVRRRGKHLVVDARGRARAAVAPDVGRAACSSSTRARRCATARRGCSSA
jgi:formamidopyrimidine-DNA glycosylase